MPFTTVEYRQVDYMQRLLSKAPNMNSAQIMERARSNFGSYPTRAVTTWLYTSMANSPKNRDEVVWTQRTPVAQTEGVTSHEVYTSCIRSPEGSSQNQDDITQDEIEPVKEMFRGTPWGLRMR